MVKRTTLIPGLFAASVVFRKDQPGLGTGRLSNDHDDGYCGGLV